MEYYVEPEKKIPVTDRVDVLVAGGGPAGIGAAVAAARQGCKTMLIEQAGDVGGVATTGMMSHWTGETRGGCMKRFWTVPGTMNAMETGRLSIRKS